MAFGIDINENTWDKEVLNILLYDRTTNRNIIWATEDYKELGEIYSAYSPISYAAITGKNLDVIMPRVLKSRNNKDNRTKKKAEVFTPSWVCNEQCNLVDHAWFGREPVFNITDISTKSWKTIEKKIEFPQNKENRTWKDYIDENRLEITCGEAPYLVSRYDTVSGIEIPIKERIGFLDRKLRIVSENTADEKDWLKWSKKAFQSIYGFEFQGDNLLLARENLLLTYIDYMEDRLGRKPIKKELVEIATIISWNIWQMDGLTQTIPYREIKSRIEQFKLFESIVEKEEKNAFCKIKDWKEEKVYRFIDLVNGGKSDK